MKTNEQYRQLEKDLEGMVNTLTAATQVISEQGAENAAFKYAITDIINSDKINTGNEPSLSCFHRSLDEAGQLVDAGFNGAEFVAQVKHDAIMSAVKSVAEGMETGRCTFGPMTYLKDYAANILTQAETK